jgi:hypothetical protein
MINLHVGKHVLDDSRRRICDLDARLHALLRRLVAEHRAKHIRVGHEHEFVHHKFLVVTLDHAVRALAGGEHAIDAVEVLLGQLNQQNDNYLSLFWTSPWFGQSGGRGVSGSAVC